MIASEKPPTAVQCVINPLNSAGNIAYVSGDFDCQDFTSLQSYDVPALAIRAVQAGALTSGWIAIFLPTMRIGWFDRAAGFRALAIEWGQVLRAWRIATRYRLTTSAR